MSDDFEIFTTNIREETLTEQNLSIMSAECLHENIAHDNSMLLCVDCGLELNKLDLNQDKCVKDKIVKTSANISRYQARKLDEKNIFRDTENMGFNEKIVFMANNLYEQVTKGKTHRGKLRRSIIFACIFHSYKLSKKPITYDALINIFKIDKKEALEGIKMVNINAPKTSPIRTTYITPANLIGDIMDKFSASQEQKDEVIKLYETIKNKSSILNRSRPQSVASGLVYWWIVDNKRRISMKDFVDKTGLSELTIVKIMKEIDEIHKTKPI